MAKKDEFWYTTWKCMMRRCYNTKAHNYKNYGAKGIKVCDEWRNSSGFAEWAKNSGWFVGATIDRLDNNKGYSPDNCRWATRKEQAKNRRTTRFITHNGVTHNVREWAKITGVSEKTLYSRLSRGWDAEALFAPILKQ